MNQPGLTGQAPRGWSVLVATACLGAAMVMVPAFGLPGRAQALTVTGLLLVAAQLASRTARARGAAALAAVLAVAATALGGVVTARLAAEGLLIVGYLLVSNAPAAMPWRVALRWLRLQAPALAWAVLAMAVIMLVRMIPVPASAWLVVAGAGATVAAAVVALPRRPREPRPPR